MTTIATFYLTTHELTELAAQSFLPILAIGAGAVVVGWGVFAIISKACSIIMRRNAQPKHD